MDTSFLPQDLTYCTSPTAISSHIPDLTYAYDTCSTNSSPSPSFMYSNLQNPHPSYPAPSATYPPALLSSTSDGFPIHIMEAPQIEFMDLTSSSSHPNSHHGSMNSSRNSSSGNRRPSTTFLDKEAASNMRIRRRAQNRASQRAFRERKEKHVQQLEAQLADLEAKHRKLERIYRDVVGLKEKHTALKEEAERMRQELRTLKAHGGQRIGGLGVGTPLSLADNDDDKDWGASLFDGEL